VHLASTDCRQQSEDDVSGVDDASLSFSLFGVYNYISLNAGLFSVNSVVGDNFTNFKRSTMQNFFFFFDRKKNMW
jgi:hypothetical protein